MTRMPVRRMQVRLNVFPMHSPRDVAMEIACVVVEISCAFVYVHEHPAHFKLYM